MNYSEYKKARNLSWRVLIEMEIKELPIMISSICERKGIVLASYAEGLNTIKRLGFESECKKTDGFSTYRHGKYYIFYDESFANRRIRFTIAHELGHVLLEHLPKREGIVTAINREPSPNDHTLEQQANIFASRLLAPACVLHGLGVSRVEEIESLCQISKTAAKYRAERLKLLGEREKDFLIMRGYSNFGMSPLEKQVYEQFYDYIAKHKL